MKSQNIQQKSLSPEFKPEDCIILVSGLPRSGTSMMMKMLEAGGVSVLTDNLRQADEDNPKGYFELEQVKKLKDGDTAWVASAKGKAVKTISAHLEYLPDKFYYKVLFMQREMKEILASQREMLIRRGEPADTVRDEKMAELFNKHLEKVTNWINNQSNFEVFAINYNGILANPQPIIDQLVDFLALDLDTNAMGKVVDPSLYRQRSQK
jgi:hypothetical protein